MLNQDVVVLIAKSTIALIDEIQHKLKTLNSSRDGMSYLVLTELYSLRTRTYILANESQFFQLDQEIQGTVVMNEFKTLKEKIVVTKDLLLLKKIVFLISMLISSIGVGEVENILKIFKKLDNL